MNSKKAIAAAVAVLVVVVAVFFAMRGRDGGGSSQAGVEMSLPNMDMKADHFVFKVKGTDGLRGILSGVRGLLPDMPELVPALIEASGRFSPDDLGLDKMAIAQTLAPANDVMDALDVLLAAGDEVMAAVGRSGDDVVAAVSMVVSEQKYAGLKDALRSAGCRVSDESASEGADESVAVTFPHCPEIHMTSIKSGASRLIVFEAEQGEAAPAIAAWKDPAKRAKIDRSLTEQNYIAYRLSKDSIPTIPRDLVAEIGWASDAKSTKIKARTNADGASIPTSGLDKTPLSFYGDGDPVVLLALDLPYVLATAYPEGGSVEEVMSIMEDTSGMSIPSDYRDDVLAVLKGARVSSGVTMKADQLIPETAYAMIEMKDTSPFDKYLMFAAFAMQSAKADGWDDVMTMSLGDGIDLTLARADGKILFGLGAPEKYAKSVSAPSAPSNKGALSYLYMSTKYLLGSDTALGRFINSELAEDEDAGVFVELIDKLGLSKIESITSVQAEPAASEATIAWR